MLLSRLAFESLVLATAASALRGSDADTSLRRRAAHHSWTNAFSQNLKLALRGLPPFRPSKVHPPYLVKRGNTKQCRLNTLGAMPTGEPTSPMHNNATTSNSVMSRTTTSSTSTSTSTSTFTSTSSTANAAPTSSNTPPPPFSLVKSYSGGDFFNQWDFFVGSPPSVPNSGNVIYMSLQDSQNAGLASINSAGHFVMSTDTTQQVSGARKSVRITSRDSINGGLVLLDAVHIPTGCGSWPAFWSNGPGVWPQNGEIDIVEGVHDDTVNQATLHTISGCTLPSDLDASVSGQILQTNCDVVPTGNAGCGILDTNTNSFGPGYNSNGGGVHAMLWDNNGISVYFFPRSSIPSDISRSNPDPSGWGHPFAQFPSTACPPFTFFKDQSLIFDINFCGDLGNALWTSTATPGQSQSCAERTNNPSCTDFVLNNGGAFTQAYWEISYVKIFQANS